MRQNTERSYGATFLLFETCFVCLLKWWKIRRDRLKHEKDHRNEETEHGQHSKNGEHSKNGDH